MDEDIKRYVRNRNRPKWCIVESYVAEEAVKFCSEFIGGATTIGMPNTRNTINKGIGVRNPNFMMRNDWELTHRNVLENTSVVQSYIQ